ncbi:[Acyl-carrier-protein] S-malonyltransferase [Oceanospirillum multiglobuliferum]|uniref:Malonyl CoA-acyl carrier protein transacylase n=1 Tax=Oceanospirillum multiglobuliferum TaxID=64969 RepID=A0A1T4R3E9_9GAMM|nr:ACP S-malonyltransferase [Oceanospirillum multiglobuliferum]OPX55259.1 [acyl-carrier-protein] S-malonyltransferase [Oceanospirillum multiglobuliferum]SKA10550.1 [Acyl-carrier-protein] S-malonyltransferase [Oceanospirillum multiglobuliferum]
MTQSLAFVFPGQGSQAVGMLNELADRYAVVRTTFEEASQVLGYDLWQLVQEGPAEDLNKTDKTQPAILTASIAVWRVWQELEGPRPAWVSGHSLGEYSALVCAGAMSFSDAVRLVQLRGQFMQDAVPEGTGAMSAILSLDDEKIEEACRLAAEGDVVAPVNYNCPGQVVIAGSKDAVARAGAKCQEFGAKKVVPLAVSVPSHCELMRPAADRLAAELERIDIQEPRIPVVQNVDGLPHSNVDTIRANLVAQLYSPVRWVSCVQYMLDQGVDTTVECGPGKVLSGLNKKIQRSLKVLAINEPESLSSTLGLVKGE